MASAGGREVGRVSIRVVPNMDKFRSEIERGLSRLKDLKVRVTPELDEDELERQTRDAADRSKAKVKFESDLNRSGVVRQAKEASLLASRFKVYFRARLDGARALAEAKLLGDSLQAVANGSFLKFDSDSLSLRKALDVAGVSEGLDFAVGHLRELKAQFSDMSRFAKQASIASALNGAGKFRVRAFKMKQGARIAADGLRDMAAAMVSAIKPGQALSNSFRGFVSLGNGFAKATGFVAAGMAGVSVGVVGLSYVIGGVVDAAIQLSKVMLALPGAVIGTGLVFGTAAAAFRGFGGAVKASFGDAEQFEEAISGLAPAAADTARAVRGMSGPLKDIQQQVQQVTFEGWGEQLAAVGDKAIPMIQRGSDRLATSFNKVGDSILAWAGDDSTINKFGQMFTVTGWIVSKFAESTKGFLTGFTELGLAGLETINKLASGLPSLGERFDAWATSAKGKQEMREWMEQGVDGFRQLAGAAGDTFSILKQVGNAFGVAFNNDALSRLHSTTSAFREWLGSADDATSRISRFADTVQGIASPWLDSAHRIFDALRPTVENLIPFFERLSSEVADDLASAIETVAPLLETMAEALKENADWIAPLVGGLVALRVGFGVFNFGRKLLTPFVSMFTGLAGAAGRGVRGMKNFSNGVRGAGNASGKNAPKMQRFGTAVRNAGTSASNAGGKFRGAAGKIGKFATPLKMAGKGLVRLVPGLGTAMLVADAGNLIYQNWDKIGPALGKAKDKVVDFGRNAGQTISEGWQDAKERFKELPDSVGRGVDRAKERLSDIGTDVGNAWDGVQNWWGRTWDGIGNWLGNKWTGIQNNATTLWNGAGNLVGSAWDTVSNWWNTTWDTIGTWLQTKWNGIKDGARDLWNGAGDLIGGAWDTVSNWWNTTWDTVGTWLNDKWNGIKDDATTMWEDASTLVGDAWDDVQNLWSSTWDTVSTWLTEKWNGIKQDASTAWSNTSTTVGNAWDGVQTWWSGTWDTVGNWLGTKWGEIKNGASTTWTDASTTVGNAWNGVQGLWTSAWSGVSNFLTGTWDNIKSNASGTFEGVSDEVSNAWGDVESDTSSTWSTVTSDISAAINNAMSSVASGMSSIIGSVAGMVGPVLGSVAGAMSGMVGSITGGIGRAVGVLATLPGRAVSAVGNLAGTLVASGRSLIQGFINGIQSMIGAVANAARSAVQAARNFFPFSPAKEGPFSGRGWVLYSGMSLGQAFADGMRREIRGVRSAAAGLTSAASAPFDKLQRDKVLQPVLEKNAQAIADARKQEADEAERYSKAMADAGDDAERRAKAEEAHAEKLAEIRKGLDEKIEAPDYTDIDVSFREYYVEGAKELLSNQLKKAISDGGLIRQAKQSAKDMMAQIRPIVGDHPLLAQVEYSINSEHFVDTINRVIDESKIAAVPVEFVVSNLDQLKSDLGMGDGVISRAIDAAAGYNANNNDDKRASSESKNEVHYHVEDMQEAIRLEQLRERKNLMRMV